jgi:predicted RNA binding protein YcfA (HicA-like mRNA interferase family)
MAPRLLLERASQLRKRVKKLGFTLDRTRGSHEQWMCETKCHTATIDTNPMSKSDLISLIRQTGCTKEEFYKGIKKCKKKDNV